ncbi:ribonuclease H2 subunit C [Nilaparvata lugens]|uniref:ribonuclease H2 subunit C n=1 Tax=Nilaparvata lugens TaxID=108931 RepID=UPI00193EB764|nr:ribonuclease H2 subunit C [Nilaparvata lugens]
MSIHIKQSKHFDEECGTLNSDVIHYVPCKIYHEGEANVTKYFKTSIKKDENKGLEASLRGYPLKGTTVDLPKGYKGLILEENGKWIEGNERTLHVKNKFNSLTYWNWDKVPTKDDAFLSALDWIEIAEAVHSPID